MTGDRKPRVHSRNLPPCPELRFVGGLARVVLTARAMVLDNQEAIRHEAVGIKALEPKEQPGV